VVMMIIVAVNIAWLCAGAALTRYFRDPRSNRIINVIFAVAARFAGDGNTVLKPGRL